MLATTNDQKPRNFELADFQFDHLTFNRTGYFLVHIASQSDFLEEASHRVEHWLHHPQLEKNEKCHFRNTKN